MLNEIRINIITDNHYLFLGVEGLLFELFNGFKVNLNKVESSCLKSMECGEYDIFCIDVNTASDSFSKLMTPSHKVFYLVSDINFGFFDARSRINRRASLRDFSFDFLINIRRSLMSNVNEVVGDSCQTPSKKIKSLNNEQGIIVMDLLRGKDMRDISLHINSNLKFTYNNRLKALSKLGVYNLQGLHSIRSFIDYT